MYSFSDFIKSHDFSDGSGCVLFHTQTGESLAYTCTTDVLLSNQTNEINNIVSLLLEKRFIQSI